MYPLSLLRFSFRGEVLEMRGGKRRRSAVWRSVVEGRWQEGNLTSVDGWVQGGTRTRYKIWSERCEGWTLVQLCEPHQVEVWMNTNSHAHYTQHHRKHKTCIHREKRACEEGSVALISEERWRDSARRNTRTRTASYATLISNFLSSCCLLSRHCTTEYT